MDKKIFIKNIKYKKLLEKNAINISDFYGIISLREYIY